MARRKGMQYIPYDYEAAYASSIELMHEWFVENMLNMHKHRKKVVYALKEITAGEQFEIEVYPQFKSMDDVPQEGRRIVKDNSKAQRKLNDKNARKYVERLINENFDNRDIWITLTYDNEHLPPDGDIDAAIKNVQNYIRRINYQRKKRGLPNAKYIYVTAYNPDAEIRWHHHVVMDGALDMETVEACWQQSSRNEVRHLQKDENGLSGIANYIVEEKNRIRSENAGTVRRDCVTHASGWYILSVRHPGEVTERSDHSWTGWLKTGIPYRKCWQMVSGYGFYTCGSLL